MFKPVSNKVNFPQTEHEILAFWARHETFRKSLDQRRDAKEFVFYDGPPFATGLPHYGHLLAGTIKDIVPRYHAMRGHRVERRFGWDCHGLPIEALAQEQLGLSGTAAIREKGIDVFNETCRSLVLKYVAEWRKTVTRMGRWVDFDNDYKTMDATFMETIWWVFKQLWDQGRIYKSYRIMPYSWKLTTPLSNFEAGSNYQDVQDPAITVRLRLDEAALSARGYKTDEPWFALIWTTTPWTLPANLAICVGPDLDYVALRDTKEKCVYVMAEARVASYYKKKEDCEVVAKFKGSELTGWKYEPIFSYLKDQPNCFQILADGFVSTEDGTGIVHMAPAYGEDDFRVCKAAGIPPVDLLDENAAFTARAPDYAGQFCKDADKAIIRRLKEEHKLVHHTTIVHSYPFCERTDTPLIYKAIEAWYAKVEDIRDQLAVNNAGVHWMPAAIGDRRFGNWLKEAKDWNISRNRFWGSCIPVWVAEDDKDDTICVGSIAELEQLSGQKVTDLHKHIVDKITFVKDGKTYKRTPEVLDCWFESGSMPYAQMHYPFENKARFEANFPADFIAEGLDQTRGWFYTLMVLATSLFGKTAFKNVVVNGLVLAEDGRKMSKRLKNYPDPNYVLDTYGADALRLYMINSPVVRADDLRFSEEGVKQCLRDFLIPLWNAYSFFVTYARIDGWQPEVKTSGLSRTVKSFDEARNAALVFVGREIVNRDDGMIVTISRNALNKMLSRSAAKKSESESLHATAVANLDELFASSIRALSGPDIRSDPNVAAIHRFYAPFATGGCIHIAKITVKQFARSSEGNRVYTVEAVQIKKPARNWVASISAQEQRIYTPQAGFHEKLCRRIDDVNGSAVRPANLLDRWILSALERLNTQVVAAMDDYDLQSAVRPFVQFIDDLTKWYIRRSRRRFWKSEDDGDKRQAYATLYDVLLRLARIAAPFTPFIAEAIHQNLRTDDLPESVHLCDFPQADAAKRDFALEAQMDEAIKVVELGRQVRTLYDLKVRQPLRRIVVVCHDRKRLELIGALKDVIADELNVRDIEFDAHETDLATITAKPDLKKLGPRLGPRLKKAADAIRTLSPEHMETLLAGRAVEIRIDGEAVSIAREEVLIERQPKPGLAVAAAADLVVALDTQLDDELIAEGLAREFVNKVQNLRKTADLDIAQRIRLTYSGDDAIRAAVGKHNDYICAETLALACDCDPACGGSPLDLNGHDVRIAFAAV